MLFDGNALVHRAFHALPPLTVSRTGEMVNAVYGFAATLLKVLAEFKPSYWATAFDRPSPTFRHKMFEEYKAQRPPTPEELKGQIDRVHELVAAFRIPIFEIDGFEADDILGTLCRQASGQSVETIIVTGDNDMLQLVLPGVRTLVPRRSFSDTILYDEEAVKQKYGIGPNQITDFKALVGDASDNIPGIPGIGEKTASKLLQQYGSLEGIYTHIDEITPDRLQTSLRQYQSQAFQSRDLVTIVKDVPLAFDLKACDVSNYDRDQVVQLFQHLEFTKLLPRLPREGRWGTGPSPTKAVSKGIYQMASTETAVRELADQLQSASEIVIALETAGKRPAADHVLGIALSPARGRASYVPVGQLELNLAEQLPLAQVIANLRPVLESVSIDKIAHDGKQTMAVLADCGVELGNLGFDVTIAAHLLGEKGLTFEALVFNRLGTELTPVGQLMAPGRKGGPPATLTVQQAADSACFNADAAWSLRDSLKEGLVQQGLWQLFSEVEMPLVPVLLAMERNGVALDTNLLREMSRELGQEMLRLDTEIYDSVGHKFNINSPQQLGKVLFEELRLPISRKTKSGYSTEASVLEGLTGLHPSIELVLQYRQLGKLKSTYIDALPALINPRTGRVHTTFNQTGTTTGRLSSSEPNLQNIPVRRGLGRKIRQAIVAPAGCFLLSADYSQIDLRALAHLSQDPELIAAFTHDEDIHSMTASRVFGVPSHEVTPEMRRTAKTVNFGVIYGMSDYGLEQATEFSREEAAQFIALYFERYPKVREYIETTKTQARKLGYVQTVTGRRRSIPEINSPNRQIREAAERMAINAPVQGSSADIIKIAMIRIHREMRRRKLKSKMLLQIHDELLFEVPTEEVDEIKSLVAELMPQAIALCVPLKIDIKMGRNWGQMA